MLPKIYQSKQLNNAHEDMLSKSELISRQRNQSKNKKKTIMPIRCKTKIGQPTDTSNIQKEGNTKQEWKKSIEQEISQLKYWRSKNRINSKRKEEQKLRSYLNESIIRKDDYMDKYQQPEKRIKTQNIQSHSFRDTVRIHHQLESALSHNQRMIAPRKYRSVCNNTDDIGNICYSNSPNRIKRKQQQIQQCQKLINIVQVDQILHKQPQKHKNKKPKIRLVSEFEHKQKNRDNKYRQQKMIKQINRFLKYQTYYAINKREKPIKDNQKQENVQKLRYSIDFPSKQNIDKSILQYQSLIKKVQIPLEIQNRITKQIVQKYSDQPGQQFLYFGYVNQQTGQKQGFGVLVTKQYIREGLWIQNQIVKGAQLRQFYKYQGQFCENQKNGKGYCQWVNGNIYDGDWVSNQRCGYGQSKSNSGQIYKGYWVNDKPHGYGQCQTKQTGIYDGYFFQSFKNGKGSEKMLNGDKYIGDFKQGIPHGVGKYIWENGMVYQGSFREGFRQGIGKIQKGNLFKAKGRFKDDKASGFFQLINYDGKRYAQIKNSCINNFLQQIPLKYKFLKR